MAVYRYDTPGNPYAASIGDLLLRRGGIEARRAAQVADAQARAAQTSGAAWAGAAQQVGQTVAAIPQQMQQAKRQGMQDEAGRIDLENARVAQKATRQAMEDRSILQSAASSGLDPDAIEAQLQQLGRGDLAQTFRKSWTDAESAAMTLRNARTKAQEAQDDYFGSLAAGVRPWLGTEDGGVGAAVIALQHAKQNGFEDADRLIAQITKNPASLPQIIQSLIEKSPTQKKLLGEESDRALRRDAESRTLKAAEQAAADRAADNARADRMLSETQRHNRVAESRPTADSTRMLWVTREGKPLRISEADYRPGDIPYSAPRSTSETAQDRQRVARMDAAQGFLTRLNELRSKINTKMGPQAGLTGLMRRGAANVGMDPDVAEYERIRAAGGRALAVAIMGAQNLSDQDANAWANMLPGATTDEQTAQRLTDQVGRMLSAIEPASAATSDSARPSVTAAPDLAGLKPGTGRKFRDGPFAGQTWAIGADGQPYRVP